MTEVYIVQEQSGTYDDFCLKNIAVYLDKEKAENFCLFKNEAIRLTFQLQEQIPINEELIEPDCPSNWADEKFKAWVEKTTILFEAREKYNREQMEILLEKSPYSEKMKEEINRLFNLGCWSYENNNKYCICVLPITE